MTSTNFPIPVSLSDMEPSETEKYFFNRQSFDIMKCCPPRRPKLTETNIYHFIDKSHHKMFEAHLTPSPRKKLLQDDVLGSTDPRSAASPSPQRDRATPDDLCSITDSIKQTYTCSKEDAPIMTHGQEFKCNDIRGQGGNHYRDAERWQWPWNHTKGFAGSKGRGYNSAIKWGKANCPVKNPCGKNASLVSPSKNKIEKLGVTGAIRPYLSLKQYTPQKVDIKPNTSWRIVKVPYRMGGPNVNGQHCLNPPNHWTYTNPNRPPNYCKAPHVHRVYAHNNNKTPVTDRGNTISAAGQGTCGAVDCDVRSRYYGTLGCRGFPGKKAVEKFWDKYSAQAQNETIVQNIESKTNLQKFQKGAELIHEWRTDFRVIDWLNLYAGWNGAFKKDDESYPYTSMGDPAVACSQQNPSSCAVTGPNKGPKNLLGTAVPGYASPNKVPNTALDEFPYSEAKSNTIPLPGYPGSGGICETARCGWHENGKRTGIPNTASEMCRCDAHMTDYEKPVYCSSSTNWCGTTTQHAHPGYRPGDWYPQHHYAASCGWGWKDIALFYEDYTKPIKRVDEVYPSQGTQGVDSTAYLTSICKCNQGYHYNSSQGKCIQNNCIDCTNGTSGSTPCKKNNTQNCISCKTGYKLNENICTPCPGNETAIHPTNPSLNHRLNSCSKHVCENGKTIPSTQARVYNECKSCNAGYKLVNKKCISCPAGEWLPANNTSPSCSPAPCANGTNQGKNDAGRVQNGCKSCKEGYRLSAYKKCTPCPKDRWSDPGNPSPTCNKNSNCQNGTLQDAGSPGRIQNGCKSCNAGYKLINKKCTPCPWGKFISDNNHKKNTCSDCPQGTYSKDSASTSCKLCSPGKYQPSPGKRSCLPCPVGKVQPSEGKSQCVNCPIGQQPERNSKTVCKPCPNGMYKSSQAVATCAPCADGYMSNPNKTGCIRCSPGMKSTVGICEYCQKGQEPNYKGEISINNDSWIKSNSESNGVNGIKKTTANGWGDAGATSKQSITSDGQLDFKCDIGYTIVGLSTHNNPIKNYTGNNAVDCGVYCYKEERQGQGHHLYLTYPSAKTTWVGNNSHKRVPGRTLKETDTITLQKKGNIVTVLQNGEPVLPSHTCRLPSNSPVKIGVALYNQGKGIRDIKWRGLSNTCTNCPEGNYKSAKSFNGGLCSPCPPGKYQDGKGGEECKSCGQNRYNDQTGRKTVCSPCPIGKECTNSTECSQCTKCKPGKYKASAAASPCAPCSPGEYQPSPGKSSCKLCIKGTYSNISGSKQCILPSPEYRASGCNTSKVACTSQERIHCKCENGPTPNPTDSRKCESTNGGRIYNNFRAQKTNINRIFTNDVNNLTNQEKQSLLERQTATPNKHCDTCFNEGTHHIHQLKQNYNICKSNICKCETPNGRVIGCARLSNIEPCKSKGESNCKSNPDCKWINGKCFQCEKRINATINETCFKGEKYQRCEYCNEGGGHFLSGSKCIPWKQCNKPLVAISQGTNKVDRQCGISGKCPPGTFTQRSATRNDVSVCVDRGVCENGTLINSTIQTQSNQCQSCNPGYRKCIGIEECKMATTNKTYPKSDYIVPPSPIKDWQHEYDCVPNKCKCSNGKSITPDTSPNPADKKFPYVYFKPSDKCLVNDSEVCESCNPGFYLVKDPKNSTVKCVKWKTCKKNQWLKNIGTGVSDRVCENCPINTSLSDGTIKKNNNNEKGSIKDCKCTSGSEIEIKDAQNKVIDIKCTCLNGKLMNVRGEKDCVCNPGYYGGGKQKQLDLKGGDTSNYEPYNPCIKLTKCKCNNGNAATNIPCDLRNIKKIVSDRITNTSTFGECPIINTSGKRWSSAMGSLSDPKNVGFKLSSRKCPKDNQLFCESCMDGFVFNKRRIKKKDGTYIPINATCVLASDINAKPETNKQPTQIVTTDTMKQTISGKKIKRNPYKNTQTNDGSATSNVYNFMIQSNRR